MNDCKLASALHKSRTEYKVMENGIKVYSVPGYNCLVGVLRPAIYVDTEKLREESTIQHVICHELQHLKVRDNIWQLVRVVCLILQWFNPFVLYAYFASKKDCELACDARIVKDMTIEERHEYGSSLLTISSNLSTNQKLSIATSMGDDKKFLETRIRSIMQSKYKGAVVISLILTGIICVVSLIGIISVKLVPKEETEAIELSTENELEQQAEDALEEAIRKMEEMQAAKNEEVNKVLAEVEKANGWSEDNVKKAFLARYRYINPEIEPKIVDCVLVTDAYQDLAGVVLFLAADSRIAKGEELVNLGYLDVNGKLICTGNQHVLSKEPEFTYLGEGKVSYENIFMQETYIAICGYEKPTDGGSKFTMKINRQLY